MVPGDILIKLSAVCAVVAFVAAVRWARGNPRSERTFRWAYHGMTATLVLASATLMVAILRHDFRFEYVIGYSSRDLPGLYLVSAFWAGQSGTYLLWGLFGALLGYFLLRKSAWEPAAVMSFYVPTIAFMHALMLNPDGNPFKLAPAVPPDGRGLNPLLQDPWMASHPPMVFLGYAAMTIPAVLALVALFKRREDRWFETALRWSLVSFVLLGAGIVLGGFWAYKVLGWGGYWGWDPVENASLIPWIVVTALIHGLIVQKATGGLPRTNLALALAAYATVFYATFLTRSGVLADFSVHSFPAGSIFKVLLGIQLLIVAVSLIALFRRWTIRAGDIKLEISWPFVLSAAVILFVVSGGMVLIGTSWPIISSAVGQASSFGPSWYNTVSQPVYLFLLALLGSAPFLAWAVRPWPMLRKRLIPTIGIAATFTVAAIALGAHGWIALLLFFAGTAALAANALRFVEVGRTRLLNTGAATAHIGFALMCLGIVGSSFWGQRQEARLSQGRPTEVLGASYTFVGHVDGSEPHDRWRIRIQKPGDDPFDTDVGMYRTGSARDSEVMHKPAIVRSLSGDIYIAPGGLEERAGHRDLTLAKGKPERLGQAELTFVKFETQGMGGDHAGMTVWAVVQLASGEDNETVRLPFTMTGGKFDSPPVRPRIEAGIDTLQLQRMNVDQGQILVHADTPGDGVALVLHVDVSTKPMIGLLWAGTVLLGVGGCVAWARRVADARFIARANAGTDSAGRKPGKPQRARRRATSTPAHAGS